MEWKIAKENDNNKGTVFVILRKGIKIKALGVPNYMRHTLGLYF